MSRFAIATALALVALAGCQETVPPPIQPQDAGPPSWKVVLDHLDGSLLSVWGASPSAVFAVGGPLGNAGFESLVVHYDGTAWKRLRPGGGETFWWVYGTSATDVWMVGEKGRITHFDGTSFKDATPLTTATLYGVYAAAPNDVWAVGGTPEGGTMAPNDVVLHFDGTSWSASPLPMMLGRTLFKVWGSGADDVYAVGEAATVWHRKGGAWTLESNPPVGHGTLLTVFGCSATDVYAVGGRDVLHSDGKTWTSQSVMLTNDVNGVTCAPVSAPYGNVAIVGFGGSKQRLVSGAWVDDFGTPPFTDLHGVWADATGAFWAAGGDFATPAAPNVMRNGTLARYGTGAIPSTLSP